MPRSRAWAVALAVLGLAVPAWAQRPFPDTTHGVVVFNDQFATWSMTEAQFGFAASHYAGTRDTAFVGVSDAPHSVQAAGTLLFDKFESRRLNFIAP